MNDKIRKFTFSDAPIATDINSSNIKTYTVIDGDDVTMTLTVHTYPSPALFRWTSDTCDDVIDSDINHLENDTSTSTLQLHVVTSSTMFNVDVCNADDSMCSYFTLSLIVERLEPTTGNRGIQ